MILKKKIFQGTENFTILLAGLFALKNYLNYSNNAVIILDCMLSFYSFLLRFTGILKISNNI